MAVASKTESAMTQPRRRPREGTSGKPALGPLAVTAYSILVFGMFMLGWQLVTMYEIVHPIILPGPAAVASALVELVGSKSFSRHLWTTLAETSIGFLIGATVGFSLALLDVTYVTARRALRPYIVFLQAMPKIALVPLIITWLGFGSPAKVVQAAILSFFPVFINSVVGLSVLDDVSLKLIHSLSATKWQILRYLRMPSAMPAFFVGLRTALTFALIGAVVSEMIAARRGLGLLLVQYQAGFEIALMYAVIVVMVAVGLLLFLLIGWLDRRLVFWRKDKSFF
jgi:NitT/TauT family transport system permease protein